MVIKGVVIILAAALYAYTLPTAVTAFHRSGQTFITWTVDESSYYDVYRHTGPINASNLSQAEKVATRIAKNSGNFRRGDVVGLSRVVLNSITSDGSGDQVSASTGVFVYTVHDSGAHYYAVTARDSTTVDTSNSVGPVIESEQVVEYVVAYSRDNGAFKGIIQFMDYAEWNPTYEGYIYLFGLFTPTGQSSSGKYPCVINLHGMSAYLGSRWDGTMSDRYQIVIDDRNNTHFYGFTDDNGHAVNYTEARIMDALAYVIRHYNVDTNRIFIEGGSMGGYGSLNIALRYPHIFAAARPILAMTSSAQLNSMDPATPVKNIGLLASHLKHYDGTPLSAWNTPEVTLIRLAGIDLPYLASMHASQDEVVPYPAQGGDFYRLLNGYKHGFLGWIHLSSHFGSNWVPGSPNINHYDWLLNNPTGNGGFDWVFRKDISYPVFSNSHVVGDYTGPAWGGEKYYHWHLMWGCPWTNRYQQLVPQEAQQIMDAAGEYKIWIQCYAETQSGYLPAPIYNDTVDITPRNLQHFVVNPVVQYTARNVKADSTVLQEKTLVSDSLNLLTFEDFYVSSQGSYLHIMPKNTLIQRQSVRGDDGKGVSLQIDPNPFNPSTRIACRWEQSARNERIEIAIYNVHGKLVQSLLATGSQLAAGLTWDAKKLASGVYVIHVRAGDRAILQRAMLIR